MNVECVDYLTVYHCFWS